MIDIRTLLIIGHTVGTVLGAGGATVGDVLFFKSIKDGRISRAEYDLLAAVGKLVWVGLAILLLSGFGFILLFLADHEEARQRYDLDKIIAKLTIVVVIFVNGLVIHYRLLPLFLARLGRPLFTGVVTRHLTLVLSSGAISGVSWYTTLVYGAWRGLPGNYWTMMIIYLTLLVGVVLVVNVIGRKILKA